MQLCWAFDVWSCIYTYIAATITVLVMFDRPVFNMSWFSSVKVSYYIVIIIKSLFCLYIKVWCLCFRKTFLDLRVISLQMYTAKRQQIIPGGGNEWISWDNSRKYSKQCFVFASGIYCLHLLCRKDFFIFNTSDSLSSEVNLA